MARRSNISRQTRLLLQAMLEAPLKWQHGYDLLQQTGLKSGTLYPILMRLSDQGLLEATWQASELFGKPPRHAYRLTRDGCAFAQSLEAPGSLDFAVRTPAKASA